MSSSSLLARLSVTEANVLRPIIQDSTELGLITPNGLLNEFQENGISSRFFTPFSEFFTYLLGSYNQTTLIDNHLIIGNGIDLTANPNAIALFYAMDPSQNWKSILSKPGQPNPPLSTDQMNQLFYLSLIGASNNGGTFNGYLNDLNNCLSNFSNQTFSTNQLLGIINTLALPGATLPENFQQAIEVMLNTPTNLAPINDLAPMEAIVEYSNAKLVPDVQNQLLRIGAMFHANINDTELDVYLPWRQFQRLLLANSNNLTVVNGPVKSGIPIGTLQESTFEGFENITQFPSVNPGLYTDDTVEFGTSNSDLLDYAPQESGIGLAMYGGANPDRIFVDLTQIATYPDMSVSVYAAGNQGEDIYTLYYNTANSGGGYPVVGVYDADHSGVIYRNCNSNIFLFNGFIVDNIFAVGDGYCPIVYTATSTAESDGTVTLGLSSGTDAINILSYEPGQFGILPNANSYVVDSFSYTIGAASSRGNIALSPYGGADGLINIYNINGTLVEKIPSLLNSSWQLNTVMEAGSDGSFYMAGTSQQNPCQLLYTVVNVANGNATSTVVDEVTDNSCSEYSPFPQVLLAPTSIAGNEIVLTYIVQRTPGVYDLCNYLPGQGVNCFANINPAVMNGVYSGNSVSVGPMNKGFLVSSLQRVNMELPYSSDVFEFDYAVLKQNYTVTNITIFGVSPLSNGYLLYYQNDTQTNEWSFPCNLNTQIFANNQWSAPLCLDTVTGPIYSQSTKPVLQTLAGDQTLLLMSGGLGNYIINPDNTINIGRFYINSPYVSQTGINSWLGIAGLPDNNVLTVYNVDPSDPEQPQQRAVALPTSYLQTPSLMDSSEYSPMSRNLLSVVEVEEDVSDVTNNAVTSENSLVADADVIDFQTSDASHATSSWLDYPLDLFKSWVDTLLNTATQYAAQLAKDCPSYFPPGSTSFWKNGGSHTPLFSKQNVESSVAPAVSSAPPASLPVLGR